MCFYFVGSLLGFWSTNLWERRVLKLWTKGRLQWWWIQSKVWKGRLWLMLSDWSTLRRWCWARSPGRPLQTLAILTSLLFRFNIRTHPGKVQMMLWNLSRQCSDVCILSLDWHDVDLIYNADVFQALIHGLNRHYYSIGINYRKNELEEKMLLNLHKKKWTDGLTLQRYDEHGKTNEATVKVSSFGNGQFITTWPVSKGMNIFTALCVVLLAVSCRPLWVSLGIELSLIL